MKLLPLLTPWEAHVQRWSSCQKCHLHHSRSQVVLARGVIPSQVVYVGEAPGESEDSIGQPFVGPAGQMLDDWISKAGGDSLPLRSSFTNLVACIPIEDGGTLTRGRAVEPSDEYIMACQERLSEFLLIADESHDGHSLLSEGTIKLIVTVGRLATDWVGQGWYDSLRLHRKINLINLDHPARVLRSPTSVRSLMVQRNVVTLAEAFRDFRDFREAKS
jgi:uracil-DNA glycosylase family 4